MSKKDHLERGGEIIKPITRRDFLKGTAFTIAGLSLGVDIFGCSGDRPPEYEPSIRINTLKNESTVVLVRSDEVLGDSHVPNQAVVDSMVNKAITSLAGEQDPVAAWKSYIKPSDTVGVKISERATHLEVVKAVVRSLQSIGVAEQRIIVWDRKHAGVGYAGIEDRNKRFGYRNNISKVITDHCTALITIPRTKVHWLAGITGGVKSWLGTVSGINTKDRGVTFVIHGDSCAEVCSINAIPVIRDKCRLVVVDALRPLFHGGPQVDPKFLWDYRGLLMSTDPVAVDTVCLKILQEKRNEFKGMDWPINPPVKHLFVADRKYGLGNSDLTRIEVKEYMV